MPTAVMEPDLDDSEDVATEESEEQPSGWTFEGWGQQVRRDTYATAYRLRRQILPHAVTATVLSAGLAGHAIVAHGASPAAVGAVLAATGFPAALAAALRVRKRRPRWARRTLLGGVGAAVWLTAAPYGVGPEQIAALVSLEIAVAARWWQVNRLGYPDPADRPVEAPDATEDLTTAARIAADWDTWIACPGGPLPGSALRAPEETAHGFAFDLILHRGRHTITTAIAALEKIASGLDREVADLIVESHPLIKSVARCRFQLILTSPIRGEVNFTGPRRRGGLLELGPFADGMGEALYRLYTDGSMWSGLIIGGTGIGKSRVVENIVISALSGGDTELWYLDPQRGGSSPALRRHADYFATMDNVDDMLDAAIAILDARGEENAVEGWTGFTPSPTRPGILIVVEECHNPFGDPARAAKWARIAREGRKVGVAILCISQSSGLDTFGGLDVLRGSVMEGNALILHVTSNTAGQLMPGLLVDPKTLPKIPGYAYIQGSEETGGRTAPFRNRNTDPDKTGLLADRFLDEQPRPGLDVLAATATLAAGTAYRDRNTSSTSGQAASAERIKSLREGILPEGMVKAVQVVAAAIGNLGQIIRFPSYTQLVDEFEADEQTQLSASHEKVLAAVAAGACRPTEVEDATGLKHRRVAQLLADLLASGHLTRTAFGRYERAA